MLITASLIASLAASPLSANMQIQASTGDVWDFLGFCTEAAVEAATWVTPVGRTVRVLSAVNKFNKVRRVAPLPKTKISLPKAPRGPMTPHEAGRFGMKLALAKLKRGHKVLGREIRMAGKGESIYTTCDIVTKADDRVICVEVKYGTGRFSANQLHYHRRKNVSAFFTGSNAKAAGLSLEKPRTVWMKQMCFAHGAEVACKLE